MKVVAVVSGKGGTGKTSLVASLAHLGRPLVCADCDVDAANLAVLLPGLDGAHEPFYSGHRVSADLRLCRGHGACERTCRFHAIRVGPTGKTLTDPFVCIGCGGCVRTCPEHALALHDNIVGTWTVREAATGPLVHAALGVAQDNSGELVSRVRQSASHVAAERDLDLILVDGPPGTGRPVQAALDRAHLALAVAESSTSGEHDLGRVLDLAAGIGVPAAVVINKADLSPTVARRIERVAGAAGAAVVGTLPFDPEVPRALARDEVPLLLPGLADEVRGIWERVRRLVLAT